MSFIAAHHGELPALFDLLQAFTLRTAADLSFLRVFLRDTVAATFSLAEKQAVRGDASAWSVQVMFGSSFLGFCGGPGCSPKGNLCGERGPRACAAWHARRERCSNQTCTRVAARVPARRRARPRPAGTPSACACAGDWDGAAAWAPLLRPALLEGLWRRALALWAAAGFLPGRAAGGCPDPNPGSCPGPLRAYFRTGRLPSAADLAPRSGRGGLAPPPADVAWLQELFCACVALTDAPHPAAAAAAAAAVGADAAGWAGAGGLDAGEAARGAAALPALAACLPGTPPEALAALAACLPL